MKVWWRGRDDTWGNAKGYNVHNGSMLDACTKLGMEFTEDQTECDVAFQIAVPTAYRPVRGKKNVLFTMYEMDSIPSSWIPLIQDVDLLVVPCRHNKTLFGKYYDGPIEVCQEGIDPEKYPIVSHKRKPGKRFTFLWVGATNPRKGYEIVLAAADLWCRNQPVEVLVDTEIILKTQRSDEQCERETFLAHRKGASKQELERQIGMLVTIDRRRVTDEEMLEIYSDANAFLLPSFGEGWGLTLTEAQATGLPCIYTPWSGPVDFMKPRFGYPVSYRMVDQKAMVQQPGEEAKIDHEGHAAMADPNDVYYKMCDIYYDYDNALRKGESGAHYIHNHFTWEQAGKRLMDIFDKHFGR